MGHDVATGIIEFIMDHFTEENEGTFTCQITDGGGKAQSSLVLIGDGKWGQVEIHTVIIFDASLKWGLMFKPCWKWLKSVSLRPVNGKMFVHPYI